MKIRHFERYLQPKNIMIGLMFLGFLGGMALSFILCNEEESSFGLWLDHTFLYLKYGELHYGNILFYVLKRRMVLLFLTMILCFSDKGKYLLLSGMAVAGGFVGYYISQFIMVKGILGSVLFVVSIFPHYFFYGYGYYCLLIFLFGNREKKTDINPKSQKYSGLYYNKEHFLIKNAAPFVVVIIGILLECYVNPFFLKLFLKIFM